jgi:hypothetical protein
MKGMAMALFREIWKRRARLPTNSDDLCRCLAQGPPEPLCVVIGVGISVPDEMLVFDQPDLRGWSLLDEEEVFFC